jgi:hypothetical protein
MDRVRWVALGLVVGLGLAWGGFSVAESAPSSVVVCTKTSNGKMKLSTNGTCKTAKKKETATTYDNHASTVSLLTQLSTTQTQLTASQAQTTSALRYRQLMRDEADCVADADYSGLDLSNVSMASMCLTAGSPNFAGANLSGVYAPNVFVIGANFTGAHLEGAWVLDGHVLDSDFTDVHLSGAYLYHTDFTGADGGFSVDWGENVMCPDGYFAVSGGCFGHGHDISGDGSGHGGLG